MTDPAPMTFGVTMPFFDQHLDFEAVTRFARSAHQLGFDGLWLGDHLVVGPRDTRSWHEAPTLLAGLAGIVPGMTLGMDVLIVPYRHPIVAAKALATLDIISGGRLVVGVGVGELKDEYAVLGVDYHKRGAITDEYIQVWKAIWHPGPAQFQGAHAVINEPDLGPKPRQRPHPPIWVAGHSKAALRRAAYLGDGWHPLGLTPDEYRTSAARLRELAEEAHRPMPALSYSGFFGEVSTASTDNPRRRPLTGGVEQILDDIGQLREIGVQNVLFRLGAYRLNNEEVLDQLHLVADEILPKARLKNRSVTEGAVT